MAIQPFLAMTAAEIKANPDLPAKIAWMACHFSPYGPGLSNLPRTLPPGALLMVDDVTPIRSHDPEIILQQLSACIQDLECSGVLLDFQRPGNKQTAALVSLLTTALPCPVAVSHFYADAGTFPVFLPPIPPSEPPETYFAPWRGREIWLEVAMDAEEVTVTEAGASFLSLPSVPALETDYYDETLLCHYRQEVREADIKFTLFRTEEDLKRLLAEAEKYSITVAVGLYQEFRPLQRT